MSNTTVNRTLLVVILVVVILGLVIVVGWRYNKTPKQLKYCFGEGCVDSHVTCGSPSQTPCEQKRDKVGTKLCNRNRDHPGMEGGAYPVECSSNGHYKSPQMTDGGPVYLKNLVTGEVCPKPRRPCRTDTRGAQQDPLEEFFP